MEIKIENKYMARMIARMLADKKNDMKRSVKYDNITDEQREYQIEMIMEIEKVLVQLKKIVETASGPSAGGSPPGTDETGEKGMGPYEKIRSKNNGPFCPLDNQHAFQPGR